MNLFDFKPEELKAVGSGLLDLVVPTAQANQYNAPLDPNVWNSEYLYGRTRSPRVAGRYKQVEIPKEELERGNKRVLLRLDLTAGEKSGAEDKAARKSQAKPRKSERATDSSGRVLRGQDPGLTNIHPFDEEKRKLKTERIGVTRGGAVKGNIDWVVDQSARKATVKSKNKTANTGVAGEPAKLTEKQIKLLKEKGVVIRYNPIERNAFVDLKGRPVKPLNGYAWSEGGRVYSSLDSLPNDLRSTILDKDKPFRFSRKSGGGSGAIQKPATSMMGSNLIGVKGRKSIGETLRDLLE
jgi:hypothetical protein